MKKNFHKIPKNILSKISKLKSDDLIVACVVKLKTEDIESGKYKNIGIVFDVEKVKNKYSVIPDGENGKYSTINVDGREIIRKDLPKYEKEFSMESPDWGDWSRGTHTVSWTRHVYHREFMAPKELQIDSELLEKSAEGLYVFKVSVSEVINKKSRSFNDDLLFDINLLQENIGSVDVFASTASREEYLKTIFINWEILPPGERSEVIEKIISKFRSPSQRTVDVIIDRYDFLSAFKPTYIVGTSGFRRYLGAKLKDNLVIFENLEYGNAVYVMFEKWEDLSKLSRIELLKSGDTDKFIRIIHVGDWKDKLKALIKFKLQN